MVGWSICETWTCAEDRRYVTCMVRKNGIEVYHCYLRSLRNIRPDFITRESERGISAWAAQTGFQRVEVPWMWRQFLLCAPKLDWLEDSIANLPRHLAIGTIDSLGPVGGMAAVQRYCYADFWVAGFGLLCN